MIHQPDISTYYDQLAPHYDEDRFANSYGQYIHEQETAILDKLLPNPPTDSTLDLGCGTGRLLKWASHGLDSSPMMLEEARRKYPEHHLSKAPAWDTPYLRYSFSAVYAFHLLMHLERAQVTKVFQEAARIIKPGGRFIFDIPSTNRRQLTGHQADNWHAAQSMTLADIAAIDPQTWKIQSYQGVLFMPIHRIPARWRSSLLWADNLLCRSPWRSYASYLVVELVRL